MADGQIELANQAAGADRRQRLTKLNQLRLSQAAFCEVAGVARETLGQAQRSLLLEAAQPFANGGHGGG
jgi:hypothetical protein